MDNFLKPNYSLLWLHPPPSGLYVSAHTVQFPLSELLVLFHICCRRSLGHFPDLYTAGKKAVGDYTQTVLLIHTNLLVCIQTVQFKLEAIQKSLLRHLHNETRTEMTEEGTDVEDEKREGGRDGGIGRMRGSALTGL